MTYESLQGIRVLDLGIITAGASTSAVLADLGAEVIKVEGPSYTDPFREWLGTTDAPNWWNESPQFRATNRNKSSVCLDLKSERGHGLFMKLVAQSDVVVENFRAGVLKRLKIDYETLRAANPGIILASISSQGQTGPDSGNTSFGSTLEASSGLAYLMRYTGETPKITGRGLNYPDQVASLFAAGAIMAALVERHRTGTGVVLDLSQRELTSFLVGEALVAAAEGNPLESYPIGVPAAIEGLFRAQDDQWVAVTVGRASAADAASLIGEELTRDSLRGWIAVQPAATAARRLRAVAAAEVVLQAGQRQDPDRLSTTSSFSRDDQGLQVKGLPMQIGEHCRDKFVSAQTLGEANERVALELMGLRQEEFDALVSERIFSNRPDKAG
ncbi:CaiB/BaiF CoA transferase family protein [Caballeronia sp. 15711]|uniref:CaiB/BaiF CoA transferase family protein n=1 Tax=Caballeronia sp. 15711 TaxID=3391029 RepID=UPI0039E67A30